MNKMNNHGLTDRQLGIIRQILSEHAEGITKASLFGSRAQGTYKSYSDIDLVLYGDLDENTEDDLWTLFHESSLPFKVDISVYQNIRYPPLKRHIDAQAKQLFSAQDLYLSNGTAP